MKKSYSEHDLQMRRALQESIEVLEQIIEQNKRLILKIQEKYQIPECRQPHNLSRD
jgi:hypothetical protein